jgi:hypothetical protein
MLKHANTAILHTTCDSKTIHHYIWSNYSKVVGFSILHSVFDVMPSQQYRRQLPSTKSCGNSPGVR